jgi:hypothetical protein
VKALSRLDRTATAYALKSCGNFGSIVAIGKLSRRCSQSRHQPPGFNLDLRERASLEALRLESRLLEARRFDADAG